MITPSQNEFLKLCGKGNLIPIYREILADLETPVSAYLKIAKAEKYSLLLESIEGEEKIARFSFLAKSPELIFEAKGQRLKITRRKRNRFNHEIKNLKENPLNYIRDILKQFQFVELPSLPRFCGGIVGYLGYDIVRYFEKLPQKTKDDTGLPDILLILVKDLIIFDHRNHKIKVVHCVSIDPKNSTDEKLKTYTKGIQNIEKTIRDLKKPLVLPKTKASSNTPRAIKSNFTQKEFEDIVLKAKEHIKQGDIIQVVLSQRFKVSVKTDPFNIYRSLRFLNPSPYMYYLNFGAVKIAGSSPELLVRCEDGVVETRPIAGTRPRGKSVEQDEALAKELLADPKEKAEHIMLVDLGRNDLGRVCQKGSIHVSEFMTIERYSHVMHIISNVEGKLDSGKDSFDVLRAAFPAGTVTGAPKIRAMEIIEDLEKVSRGPYAGCIAYFSFSGNLDSCITIRTIVMHKGHAYIQAGAGIVADSDPAKEFQETLNKAKAQLLAIDASNLNNARGVTCG